jgi:glutathione S-transferase
MPKIVLHQWEISPFCNKVRRALRHKGLTFEVVTYNGLRALEAAKLSAVGTLPVLDFDGERVVDSAAICELLDRKVPSPALYPEDPAALAMVRFWEDWAGQSLYFFEIYFRMLDPVAMEKAAELLSAGRPSYERALLRTVLKRRYPKKLAQQGLGKLAPAEVERRFLQHLDGLETLLGKGPWLVGDTLTAADLAVAGQLDELVRTSRLAGEIRRRPNVAAWLDRSST